MAEVTEQQDELSVETAFQELDRLADRLEWNSYVPGK